MSSALITHYLVSVGTDGTQMFLVRNELCCFTYNWPCHFVRSAMKIFPDYMIWNNEKTITTDICVSFHRLRNKIQKWKNERLSTQFFMLYFISCTASIHRIFLSLYLKNCTDHLGLITSVVRGPPAENNRLKYVLQYNFYPTRDCIYCWFSTT